MMTMKEALNRLFFRTGELADLLTFSCEDERILSID